MSDALFISQSPLQFINNIEAQIKIERGQGLHIIFVRDKQSSDAIESITKLFDIKNYKKYRITKFFRAFFPFFLLSETKADYEKIYFGNTTSYTSFIINKVRPKKLIHVDDGTRTIALLKLDSDSKFYKPPLFRWLDKSYLKNSTFFTYYFSDARRSGKPHIINTLDETRKYSEKLGDLIGVSPAREDQKIFIGSNIIKTYLDIQKAFELLDKEISLKNSIYLMHRYDDESIMSSIAEKYCFQLKKINLPIELYFHHLWQKNKPGVWTFGSTAIDTLTLLSPETHFNVARLDPNRFSKDQLSKAFFDLYSHYQSQENVTLHDLFKK